jgi:hypothetical protein
MRDARTRNARAAAEIEALAQREGLALQVQEIDVTDEDSRSARNR